MLDVATIYLNTINHKQMIIFITAPHNFSEFILPRADNSAIVTVSAQ